MEMANKQANPLSSFAEFPENEGNFRRLVEDFDSLRGIIPFVGAGASIPFGFPSWTQFLLRLGLQAGIEADVRALISESAYEEAAEKLQSRLHEQAFNDAIEDAFGDHKLKGIHLVGPVTIIPQLSRGVVLTTNFDHVIESAFRRSGTAFEDVLWGAKVDIVGRAITQNRRVLVKLHGDVNDRTDRIITVREYKKNYGRQRPLTRVLREIFSTHPVLFIGCSLSADRTVKLLGEIASASALACHYALVEAPADLQQLHDRARFLSQHRIRPIWYPSGHHELIETLLTALLQQSSSDSLTSALPTVGPSISELISNQQSVDETRTPGGQKLELPPECEAISHVFTVGGHEGRVIVSYYDKGRPAELFILMGKEGSTVSGLMDCFGRAVSLGLQYGVAISTYIDAFSHTRFEPSGWSGNPDIGFAKSVSDYIFRWLALRQSQTNQKGTKTGESHSGNRLPDECISISNSFSVGGHAGVLTVAMYPDGSPGAIQMQLEKEGGTVSGLVTCWCSAMSIALQHGVPLKALWELFSHTRFEPSGWTNNPDVGFAKSIADYVGRWLKLKFEHDCSVRSAVPLSLAKKAPSGN
jgi:hypothetical protein